MFGHLLAPGTKAPDFTAQDHEGRTVTLAGLRGKHVILVFYPGDDTPTCTVQLQELRDAWHDIQAAGAVVYGVNPFSMDSHRHFVEKHSFPFPLIVDKGGRLAHLYHCGIWLLVRRTVYIIAPDGTIRFAQRGKPSPSDLLTHL